MILSRFSKGPNSSGRAVGIHSPILLIVVMSILMSAPPAIFGEEMQYEDEAQPNRMTEQDELIESLIRRLDKLEGREFLNPQDEFPTGPQLSIRGSGDINFVAEEDIDGGGNSPNTFSLGDTSLLITSELSNNVHFLSELSIEFNDENRTELHLPRVQLTYRQSDLLSLAIGRMHTNLGYWNTAYHHSTWLFSTTSRPELFRWEDDGGVMPVHQVGVQVFGKARASRLNVGYNLAVSNGRGKISKEVQNIRDRNDEKAFNGTLYLIPNFAPGLKLGVTAYFDTIPSDPDVPGRDEEIDERIIGAYLSYIEGNIELLGEVAGLSHHLKETPEDHDIFGFYVQGGYQMGRWKPYYRFDLVDFKGRFAYFSPNDADIRRHTAGIRWDLLTWNAIKLEYVYTDRDDSNDTNALRIQSAFTF